jgi:hypothetical protein
VQKRGHQDFAAYSLQLFQLADKLHSGVRGYFVASAFGFFKRIVFGFTNRQHCSPGTQNCSRRKYDFKFHSPVFFDPSTDRQINVLVRALSNEQPLMPVAASSIQGISDGCMRKELSAPLRPVE